MIITNADPYKEIGYYILSEAGWKDDAFIVKIKTKFGVHNELFYDDGPDWNTHDWVWQHDWYEGGEVELLGFAPVNEIVLTKEQEEAGR